MLRKAEETLETILKDSSEARKLAVAVQGLEFGGLVSEQLKKYGESMEKTYSVLQALLGVEKPQKAKIEPLIEACAKKKKGFDKAKAGFVHVRFLLFSASCVAPGR